MNMLTATLICAMMALTAETAKDSINRTELSSQSLTCCPNGWTVYNGGCYLYIPNPMSWVGAEKNCQSLGGNLVSVHSTVEYYGIQSLIWRITNAYTQTWLGGSDGIQEGVWLWSDGTPFDFGFWSPGQPDDFEGNQDCIVMNFGESRQFDDLACTAERPSICATKPLSRPETGCSTCYNHKV